MGIKKSVFKIVGETLLPKEVYEYKKTIKEELEKIYKGEIESLKTELKDKQKEVDKLILINKDINKEKIEEVKVEENKIKKDKKEKKEEKKEEKRFDFPRNMLE